MNIKKYLYIKFGIINLQISLYLILDLIDGHLSVYISSSNRTIFRVRKSQ